MCAASTKSKIDHVDLIDWMSFLPSNLIEEISSNTEALANLRHVVSRIWACAELEYRLC